MMNGMLVIKDINETDLEYLIGCVVLVDMGGYVVIPEDLYDSIPDSIGNKYGIHHIDIDDQF